MSITKFPCGCKHDDRNWIYVCSDCRVPWAELHKQAKEDHLNNRRDQREDFTARNSDNADA